MTKYVDNVHINKTLIPNTLIDLGDAINVTTKEAMGKINFSTQCRTPTILQLDDKSTVKLDGIVDDVIVSIDSWESPKYFMILQPKSNLGGYPLIL